MVTEQSLIRNGDTLVVVQGRKPYVIPAEERRVSPKARCLARLDEIQARRERQQALAEAAERVSTRVRTVSIENSTPGRQLAPERGALPLILTSLFAGAFIAVLVMGYLSWVFNLTH
jgi:hypothetical protein